MTPNRFLIDPRGAVEDKALRRSRWTRNWVLPEPVAFGFGGQIGASVTYS
jgi:hypothetical protein